MKTPVKKEKKLIAIRIPRSLDEKFSEICKRNFTNKSETILGFIRKVVRKNQEILNKPVEVGIKY